MRRRPGLPEPQGIDDYTGFKVDLGKLKKDWAGLYSTDPDKRNPQDFVRGVKDNQALPFARPEPPDSFAVETLQFENLAPILLGDGSVLTTEGTEAVL